MTVTYEYAWMALALISGVPVSRWPTHDQKQYGRPGAADTVQAMIATRTREELEQSVAHSGPVKYVRGQLQIVRWWAGEPLSKSDTKAPSCLHDGERAVERSLLVCQECGWEVNG